MTANLSAIFYLVSGVLFILALRGLSSPDTSRQGNYFGIAGMIIAIVVTFLSVGNFSSSLAYVLIFLVIGGAIGALIAFKIPMTAMPELVAGFHSLVGLAAVFAAIAAFLNPEAFNLGIIGGGQLGSMLSVAAKKLNINTIIYCDDIDAPAQNFCNEFIFGDYNDKKKIVEFVFRVNIITYEFENILFEP